MGGVRYGEMKLTSRMLRAGLESLEKNAPNAERDWDKRIPVIKAWVRSVWRDGTKL
jgi:hypothetical protein